MHVAHVLFADDARLIAAAPDLLSACEAMLAAFQLGGSDREMESSMAQAQAVITKATNP